MAMLSRLTFVVMLQDRHNFCGEFIAVKREGYGPPVNLKRNKKTVVFFRHFQQHLFKIDDLRIIQAVDVFREHVDFY